MENTEKNLSQSFLFSQIGIDNLVNKVSDKVIEGLLLNSPSKIQKEVIEFDDLLNIIPRTPPTIRRYIRAKKLRSHYFDEQSPVFLMSEILEDVKNLPDYATIKRKRG